MNGTESNTFCLVSGSQMQYSGSQVVSVPMETIALGNSDYHNPPREPVDEETEDEEVKMNCIVGSMQDSDFSSDSEDDGPVDDEMQEVKGDDGVVEFVSRKVQQSESGPPICRPKPVVSRTAPRLPSHPEEPDESSAESVESVSVAARGTAISLGGSNDGDDSSDGDESSEADDAAELSIGQADDNFSASESEKEEEILGVKTDRNEDMLPTGRPSILQQLEVFNNLASHPQEVGHPLQRRKAKAKRVLSSNTLAALNTEAGRDADSPKRMRSSPVSRSFEQPPELSLGASAVDGIRPLPRQGAMRGSSPILSSDDEELDKQLSEELERKYREAGADSSPVPLLTPPQSPLTVDNCEGTTEWPSNLVVDSAMMTAVTDTRALSPASLQDFETSEEERLAKETSSLTPLLRSIYVGID